MTDVLRRLSFSQGMSGLVGLKTKDSIRRKNNYFSRYSDISDFVDLLTMGNRGLGSGRSLR